MEQELRIFIQDFEKELCPLTKSCNLAYWNAAISGKEEEYKKAEELQLKLVKFFADKEKFLQLKKIKEAGVIQDSLLQRQLTILYNQFMLSLEDTAKLNEIVRAEVAIEQKYSTFRAEIKGKKYSDNDIDKILKESTDEATLKEAWTAHKSIGALVADDVRALVKKRNAIARTLGFKNYHQMHLSQGEQDPEQIEKIFDELNELTLQSFNSIKVEIDSFLGKRFSINPADLKPWHYQNRFFQESPKIHKTDLDKYFEGKNLEELTKTYYNSIGLNIDDLLSNSDLYEKPGKNQHAFCMDVDNEGDVRVLCNLKSNAKWMNTILHEFGHALYDKHIDRSLPYTLRDPAHTFTTEAIAMMFGRMASNPQWLQDIAGINDAEKKKIAADCYESLRMEQLVFSRWAQVMYRFEKSMYADPDQDLNQLWWTLVEKYQGIRKPEGRNEPDWASKVHIATAPCYYHNYLLGELLASQLHYYIVTFVLHSDEFRNQSYFNHPEVGKYLKDKVFLPGSRYEWPEMIKRATGEPLTAKYYARQFVQ